MGESMNRGDLIVDLLEAAVRTEGKGQLNIGKLLRACATSVAQSAAGAGGFPDDREQLAEDLIALSERLRESGLSPEICDRVELGGQLLGRDEQSYLDQFPDPYVCRRCGSLAGSVPESSCDTCGAHPLTFQRFAPIYWMGAYSSGEVLERLEANPSLLREAIQPLSPHRLDWKPRGTAWAATDVLRHLRDAQSVLAQRIDMILDEDDPTLEFKPVFAWTNQQTGETESGESIFESYASSRRDSVSRLRGITPQDWARTGLHEEFGRVTLLEQASYFAAHELTHLRQLEQLGRTDRESP